MFKIGEIRELIRLLDETSLAELHVETDDMKLHLKKTEIQAVTFASQPAPLAVPAAPAPAASPASAAPLTAVHETASTKAQTNSQTTAEESLHVLKSPMVGTFYRSPSPDAPSYVEVGAHVGEKTVVCIVEAMKLMNEIEAEVNGDIAEILVENGQLVEYGQPLFKIKLK